MDWLAEHRRPSESEHDQFRASVGRLLASEIVPCIEEWRKGSGAPGSLFRTLGAHGFLGMRVAEIHGGGGVDDPVFLTVLLEEAAAIGAVGITSALARHVGVALPLLEALEQSAEGGDLVSASVSGESVVAVATTVANAPDGTVVRCVGAGPTASTLVVRSADSIFLIPPDALKDQDITVRQPLGGRDCSHADVLIRSDIGEFELASEVAQHTRVAVDTNLQLWSAVVALASARRALTLALEYVAARTVFGKPLSTFDNTRQKLSTVAARVASVQLFVDECVLRCAQGTLSVAMAAAALMEAANVHDRAVDESLQLHGGYGYMREYPISTAFADAQYLRHLESGLDSERALATELGLVYSSAR